MDDSMPNRPAALVTKTAITMGGATFAPVTASGQPTTITTRMPIADTTGGLAQELLQTGLPGRLSAGIRTGLQQRLALLELKPAYSTAGTQHKLRPRCV